MAWHGAEATENVNPHQAARTEPQMKTGNLHLNLALPDSLSICLTILDGDRCNESGTVPFNWIPHNRQFYITI